MLLLFCSVLFISLALTFFVRKFALKKQILDIPNERSSHTIPTPRGGGLAIAISWYLAITVLYFLGKIEGDLFFALLSGVVLSVISFIDDIRNLSPKIRMVAQFTAAVLALVAMGGSSLIDIGFLKYENRIILSLLSIPFIIWFINLFNFLDGIDGYLGMEGIFVFSALWFFTGNNLLLIFVAAIAGFLILNWPAPKAKIFCGDVGSTLIGFNVAVFSIYFQKTDQLSIVIPIIVSALFWFDATITLIRRWRNGEELSVAHRKHAYQRIVQAGFSHKKTVAWAISLNVVLFLLAYLTIEFKTFSIGFILIVVLSLWFVVKQIDKKKAFQ